MTLFKLLSLRNVLTASPPNLHPFPRSESKNLRLFVLTGSLQRMSLRISGIGHASLLMFARSEMRVSSGERPP